MLGHPTEEFLSTTDFAIEEALEQLFTRDSPRQLREDYEEADDYYARTDSAYDEGRRGHE
jgi:hypothetical protein